MLARLHSSAALTSPRQDKFRRTGTQVPRGRLLATVLLALLAIGMLPASAAADKYGSIAYSPSTGAKGWSFDHHSRYGAEHHALAQCGKHAGDCKVVTWFVNGCGALAIGQTNYHATWGRSRYAAEHNALHGCKKAGGYGCKVVAWSCTAR